MVVAPAATQPVKEALADEDDIEINTLSEEDDDNIKVMVYRSRNN